MSYSPWGCKESDIANTLLFFLKEMGSFDPLACDINCHGYKTLVGI